MVQVLVPAMNCDIPVTDEALEEANRKLARYAGARVQLWRYAVSHGRLILEVEYRDGPFSHEYWSFFFVERVCMPTAWRLARPSVRRINETDFIFSDDNVEVVAVELTITCRR